MAAPLTTPREPSRTLGNTAWSADHLPLPGPPSSRTVRHHDRGRSWRVSGPVDGLNRRSGGRGRAPSAGRLAQGRHVQHAHPAPGRLDPSERPHGVKRSPDGLERCARPAGELLLGERKRDVDKVAVRFSEAVAQLGEAARDPCEAVVRREQPTLLVGLTEALAEQPQQARDGGGVRGQPGEEVGGRDSEDLYRLERHDRRRARRAVEGRELADELAGTAKGEYDLATRAGGRADLDASGREDHHPVGHLSLMAQRLPAAETAADRALFERREHLRRQRRQKAMRAPVRLHFVAFRHGCRAGHIRTRPSRSPALKAAKQARPSEVRLTGPDDHRLVARAVEHPRLTTPDRRHRAIATIPHIPVAARRRRRARPTDRPEPTVATPRDRPHHTLQRPQPDRRSTTPTLPIRARTPPTPPTPPAGPPPRPSRPAPAAAPNPTPAVARFP